MDGPKDYHTKWSKLEKDKYYITSWNLKNNTNESIYKTGANSKTHIYILKGMFLKFLFGNKFSSRGTVAYILSWIHTS